MQLAVAVCLMSQPAARVVLTCVRLFFVWPGTRNFPSEKKWVETIKGESDVKTVERRLKKKSMQCEVTTSQGFLR